MDRGWLSPTLYEALAHQSVKVGVKVRVDFEELQKVFDSGTAVHRVSANIFKHIVLTFKQTHCIHQEVIQFTEGQRRCGLSGSGFV